MTPVSYYAPGEITSPKFGYAFARGCKGTLTQWPPDDGVSELFDGPVAAFGSPAMWPVLRKAQAEKRDWFYGDHGYFGRGTYYRVTRNAYQHDGSGEYSPHRFELHRREVKPWRQGGKHILVCPNSNIYMGLHGLDGEQWLRETLATIRQHTKREVIVRWKHTPVPIRRHLVRAHAVVVFSSAAALDALIDGVPVFVLAPFAAGSTMGLSDLSQIESPIYPENREPFLWALAANQWTLAEMIDGQAWAELGERERAAA
jgi:hypothetical protein